MEFSQMNESQSEDVNILGMKIYKQLREDYPEHDSKNFDLILNSLCAALIFLMRHNIEEENRKIIVSLVNEILNKNL